MKPTRPVRMTPLDWLMGSRSKVRVLRVLCSDPDRDFTEREIARLASVSPNTANLALASIRDTGVVLFRRLGRTHAYRLNRNSHLSEAVAEVFRTEDKLAKSLLKEVKDAFDGMGTVVVFGSHARGEAVHGSDLDILVVTKMVAASKKISDALTVRVMTGWSVILSVKVVHPREMQKPTLSPYLREAKSEGVVLLGPPLEATNGSLNQDISVP